MAVWQWTNYVLTQVPEDKDPVLLNLDETSVALYHGDQKGNVVARTRSFLPHRTPVQRDSRKDLRACLTRVATVCDRPDAQQVLPQELLGNTNVLLARDIRAAQGDLPPNVRIIRAKSGWTNVPYMCGLMQRIAAAVRRVSENLVPILLMDIVPDSVSTQTSCVRRHAMVCVLF